MTAYSDIVGRLIAFDTTSRNSNLALIDYVRAILELAGARIRLTHNADGAKANLFATIGPDIAGGYVLSGHTDVVPVDGQNWSSDPFSAEIRENRIFGRGACDMKGFIGVVLALVPEFAKADLKRPIHVALSYDEEIGCIGVRGLLDDLNREGIKPSLAIIGEPTEMHVVGAHKAGAVIETTALGREGHSSAPAKGANAVMMAGEFVGALVALGSDLEKDTDAHFDPPYTTVQANMVGGGTAVNVLAKEARVTWEYRALPDGDVAAILKKAEGAQNAILPRYRAGFGEAAFATKIRAQYPGLIRDIHSPALRFAAELTGENDVQAVSYGTEAGLFQAAGISAFVCGPGSIAQAHRTDEFVALEQLDQCAAFLRKVRDAATR